MTVGRQLALVIAGFAIALPGGGFILSYTAYRNQRAVSRLSLEGKRQIDSVFAVIRSVGKAQNLAQELVRQKDPDQIERLLAESQSISSDASAKITALGASGEKLGNA